MNQRQIISWQAEHIQLLRTHANSATLTELAMLLNGQFTEAQIKCKLTYLGRRLPDSRPIPQVILDDQGTMGVPDPTLEQWTWVNGQENHPALHVSNFGRVQREGRFLHPRLNRAGYAILSSYFMQGLTGTRLARLVLFAFAGRPTCLTAHATHKNGVRHDNRLCNLMWTCGGQALAEFEDKSLPEQEKNASTNPSFQ